MKEINLREFYPEIYKTDLFISLPDEVVDVLVEYQRKEVAYWKCQEMCSRETPKI